MTPVKLDEHFERSMVFEAPFTRAVTWFIAPAQPGKYSSMRDLPLVEIRVNRNVLCIFNSVTPAAKTYVIKVWGGEYILTSARISSNLLTTTSHRRCEHHSEVWMFFFFFFFPTTDSLRCGNSNSSRRSKTLFGAKTRMVNGYTWPCKKIYAVEIHSGTQQFLTVKVHQGSRNRKLAQ